MYLNFSLVFDVITTLSINPADFKDGISLLIVERLTPSSRASFFHCGRTIRVSGFILRLSAL